jgi:hypothetical protein
VGARTRSPFWSGGGGTGGSLSGPGTDITTYWSAVQNAEKLVHASCDLSGVGYSDGVPCTRQPTEHQHVVGGRLRYQC